MSAIKDIKTGQFKPKNHDDLIGRKFRRLAVLGYFGESKILLEVLCDCGRKRVLAATRILAGQVSCGCANTTHRSKKREDARLTRLKIIWRGMLSRCLNVKHTNYCYYGARGISVAERWLDFNNFRTDMGYPPNPTFSIDRIDNNKSYSRENCRWATRDQQSNNKRSNRKYIYKGKILTISQISKIIGVNRATIAARINSGWPEEKAFSSTKRRFKYNKRANIMDGKTEKTVKEFSSEINYPYKKVLFLVYKKRSAAQIRQIALAKSQS